MPVGCMPVGCMPVGCMPVGCMPVGCMPVGCMPVTLSHFNAAWELDDSFYHIFPCIMPANYNAEKGKRKISPLARKSVLQLLRDRSLSLFEYRVV